MPTLHFICGKAGAGKTTLARALGRELPAIVFVEDAWSAKLGFEVRTLPDDLAAAGKVRSVIGPLATDLLRLGVSTVFDFAGRHPREPAVGARRVRGGRRGPPPPRHRGERRDLPRRPPPLQRGAGAT